jgi:hypothetical protein
VLGSLPLGWTQYDKQQILTPGPRSTRANVLARTAMTPTEVLLIIIMFGGVCVVVGVVICIGLFIIDAVARHWPTQPRSGLGASSPVDLGPHTMRNAASVAMLLGTSVLHGRKRIARPPVNRKGQPRSGNSERIRKL